MSKYLLPFEAARRTASLPPGVTYYGPRADEESRRDYTFDARAMRAFDALAVREIRARMIIRQTMHQQHRAMRRAQYR